MIAKILANRAQYFMPRPTGVKGKLLQSNTEMLLLLYATMKKISCIDAERAFDEIE